MASSHTEHRGLRRRHWLVVVPAALVVAGVASYRLLRSPTRGAGEPNAFPALVPGMELGRWTLIRVHPMHLGAVPVILETETGQRYQIDVVARDPAGPAGVADTERLSLFIVNSGTEAGDDGQRPTDEEQGLGAMALARVLAEQELPEGLLTMRERQRSHPGGSFGVALH